MSEKKEEYQNQVFDITPPFGSDTITPPGCDIYNPSSWFLQPELLPLVLTSMTPLPCFDTQNPSF